MAGGKAEIVACDSSSQGWQSSYRERGITELLSYLFSAIISARRTLVWAIGQNGHLFVLRFDPKHAKPYPLR